MEAAKRLVDRNGWPPGPWDDEPDRVEWRDEGTGYPCLITRHEHFGNLCGYVAVPPGHPLHGVGYDYVGALAVHGGVTYASACADKICHVPQPGEPDDVWWFGFDCGHVNDLLPGGDQRFRHMQMLLGSGRAEYRTLGYVVDECRKLAQQLKSLDGTNDQG